MSRAIAKLPAATRRRGDVAQSLREQLLVGRAGAAGPQSSRTPGAETLAGWLRVAAVRAGLKRLRGESRHDVDIDDAKLAARSMGDDPELAYMKVVPTRVPRSVRGGAERARRAREEPPAPTLR